MTYEEYAADPVPCCDAATGSETKWALGQLAADFITSRDVCECWGAEWDVVVSQSFDNVILAFLSLFEIATTEGWVDVMYAAVDATAVDMQPIRDEHEVWTVLFMLFMVLGSMLFLNLFVGVTIDHFNKMKHQSENSDSLFMTDVQQAWVKTQEMLLKIEPERQAEAPSNRARRACHHLVMDPRFEKGVMMCIFLNTAVMAMEHFGQSDTWAVGGSVAADASRRRLHRRDGRQASRARLAVRGGELELVRRHDCCFHVGRHCRVGAPRL